MSVSSSLRWGGGVVVTCADSWSCDLCNLTHQDLPLEGLHTCFMLHCCHLDILNNFEPEALHYHFSLSSVTQSCPTLCDPMDCSTPGFPVHHQLPELAQIHVYWVSDAIQPSHPLSSPSPPTINLSQCQGLFQWVSSSHQVATVLEFQTVCISPSNEYSALISFRMDWLYLLEVQGTLKKFLQEHQFFSTQHSLQSKSHIHIWPLEKP